MRNRNPCDHPEPPVLPALRQRTIVPQLVLGLSMIVCLNVLGCGDAEQHWTLVAANERIHDLKKETTRLEQLVKDLQAQRVRREVDLARSHEERLAAIKQDGDDRQARQSQLQEEKVAHLENTIATLRLELGAARREMIVLQGLVDRKPRVEGLHTIRSGRIETVLGLFGGLTLLVLIVVGSRYRLLRQRHDLLLLQGTVLSPILEQNREKPD